MTSEDLVGALLGQDLYESVGIIVGLGARVGDHGEGSDVVLDALGLEVLLGLSDPCDLGVSVDDAVVVDEVSREKKEGKAEAKAIPTTTRARLHKTHEGMAL